MTPSVARRWLPIVIAVMAAVLYAAQQEAARPPAFEVVSVKLNRDCYSGGAMPVISPGRVELRCVHPRSLIRLAYVTFAGANLAASMIDVVNGPAWITNDYYDIAAMPAVSIMQIKEIVNAGLNAPLPDGFRLGRAHASKQQRGQSSQGETAAEAVPKLW